MRWAGWKGMGLVALWAVGSSGCPKERAPSESTPAEQPQKAALLRSLECLRQQDPPWLEAAELEWLAEATWMWADAARAFPALGFDAEVRSGAKRIQARLASHQKPSDLRTASAWALAWLALEAAQSVSPGAVADPLLNDMASMFDSLETPRGTYHFDPNTGADGSVNLTSQLALALLERHRRTQDPAAAERARGALGALAHTRHGTERKGHSPWMALAVTRLPDLGKTSDPLFAADLAPAAESIVRNRPHFGQDAPFHGALDDTGRSSSTARRLQTLVAASHIPGFVPPRGFAQTVKEAFGYLSSLQDPSGCIRRGAVRPAERAAGVHQEVRPKDTVPWARVLLEAQVSPRGLSSKGPVQPEVSGSNERP